MNKYLIVTVAISFILFVSAYIFITLNPPAECEVVSGDKHIYSHQCLPPNYKPSSFSLLSNRASYLSTDKLLAPLAAEAVEKLIKDAEEDGMCLVVIGAYRSYEEQLQIYKSKGGKVAAQPGRSEHQTGLAVDFTGCPMTNGKRDDSAQRLELRGKFSDLPEYRWLLENASYYGFEQSYRKDNVSLTGYPPEPWHWKFIE